MLMVFVGCRDHCRLIYEKPFSIQNRSFWVKQELHFYYDETADIQLYECRNIILNAI